MSEDWREQALCAQIGGEFWFPHEGHTAPDAKRICRRCPVRLQCLQLALDNDEQYGIWGGLNEKERRQLKPKTRVCAICSEKFAPSGASHRYCSPECRTVGSKRKSAEYESKHRYKRSASRHLKEEAA